MAKVITMWALVTNDGDIVRDGSDLLLFESSGEAYDQPDHLGTVTPVTVIIPEVK